MDEFATDKAGWGVGPWLDEPDRVVWEHAGLPCLVRRSRFGGNWCGYVAVPPQHPFHGKPHDDVDSALDVHGGLTYANACSGEICHVPKPGEPDDVWWFGFDCGHAFDVLPAMNARERERGYPSLAFPEASYKDLDYVRAETNQLAEQIARMAP